MKIGACLLCGGKSSRMGRDKSDLELDGSTFRDRILTQLRLYDEVILSVNGREAKLSDLPSVTDIYPDCGPMGGLHAALSACTSEVLLTVACDLPFYTNEVADLLCAHLTEEVDAVVPVTSDGRLHPLCALYRKNAAQVFETHLKEGNYRLRTVLDDLRVCYLPLPDELAPALRNINTPEDYAAAQGQQYPL